MKNNMVTEEKKNMKKEAITLALKVIPGITEALARCVATYCTTKDKASHNQMMSEMNKCGFTVKSFLECVKTNSDDAKLTEVLTKSLALSAEIETILSSNMFSEQEKLRRLEEIWKKEHRDKREAVLLSCVKPIACCLTVGLICKYMLKIKF